MLITQVIEKKSKGLSLTKEEINFFVNGYLDGSVKDYQASSMLMAIKLKGLNDQELIDYATALIESGEQFPLREDLVDKHSSGGVGDKTTISLLPILASMGLKIFKMSGRGLGFTGGTIDKLESVEGFDVSVDIEKAMESTEKCGVAITSQMPNLVPADGIIYALRDVTATVDSKELIAASIISKKIASGAKNILIDLKVGSGAFFETIEEAKEVSRLMKIICDAFDRELFILLSSMDQPLGVNAGNKNEVVEALNFLKGEYSEDFYELIKKIATELHSKSKNVDIEESTKVFEEVITSGKALEKAKEWFASQGANNFDSALEFNPAFTKTVLSTEEGYIKFNDVKNIGNALVQIGAGRLTKEDSIDFDAGVKFLLKNSDKVAVGQPIMEIFSSREITEADIERFKSSVDIVEEPFESKVIVGELRW